MTKKGFSKRFLSTCLAGTIALGAMSGCGKKDDEKKDSSKTETKTEEGATQGSSGGEGSGDEKTGIEGWTAFDKQVKLEVAVYNRDNPDWANPEKNYWTDYVQKNFGDKYNIKVTYVPIPRGAVLENYALLAADQDLPTILMEYDYPKQAKWVADGYLQSFDMNEFAKVAPTYYQRMVDLDQIKYTQLDGETYFCLAERPFYDTDYSWVTIYRKDWLKEAGFDEYPTTWEEQKKLYTKLIENGHEYPLGGKMLNGVGSDQNYKFRSYPQDELEWATVGGYATPALGSEANKKYLKRQNEMYNLGFINPEYYITDLETDKANFVSGKTFQYEGYISAEMDYVTGVYENNPDCELGVYVVPADKAVDEAGDWVPGSFRPNNPFGMMVSFAHDATADELKAAWMYMEWMTQEDVLFTMQWGEEGVNFDYDENGLPVARSGDKVPSDKLQGFNNNKDIWCVTVEAKVAGTIEDVVRANTPNVKDDLASQVIDQYYQQKKIFEAGYAASDCVFAKEIVSESDNQQTLVGDYIVYRDQLVQCKPDEFDALYDKLAKKYKDAGFQDIIDEKAEAYKDGLSTTLK